MKKINEETLQQVSSAYAWQWETNDWSIKQALSQNIAGRPFNITIIINSFKSLIKQAYKIGCTYKLNKKEDQITSEQK